MAKDRAPLGDRRYSMNKNPEKMPETIWVMDNNTYSKYPTPNRKGGYPRENVEHKKRVQYIRADLHSAELRDAIARASLCLLKPNDGICDTIWMDKTQTLYEHLVSYLDVELTGDIDEDTAILDKISKGG